MVILKEKLKKHANKLIQKIERVEFYARPAEDCRDKIFSNFKYRANRLKTCVKMVTQGKFWSDCSRGLRKTNKAYGGKNCVKEFEGVKKSYQKYKVVFFEFSTLSKK